MEPQEQMSVASGQRQLSPECSVALSHWLAIYVQHFRQEILELGVLAYQIGLHDLTLEQLNRGCEQSLRECDFFPKVRDIRMHSNVVIDKLESYRENSKAADMYEKAVDWARVNAMPGSLLKESLPPVVEYAVRRAGGTKMLLNAEQQYWTEKKFVEAYLEMRRTLRENGITNRDDAQRFIFGMSKEEIEAPR